MNNAGDRRDSLPKEAPITEVCVVENKERCPQGYVVLSETEDGKDGDLWTDKFFGKKVTRYICFNRAYANGGGNVLADVAILGERDIVPTGYSQINATADTGEIALKKRILCIKMLPRNMTDSAICDIKLLAKTKRPPPGFTFVGEVNSISVSYKMGPVQRTSGPVRPAPGPPQMTRQSSQPLSQQPVPASPSYTSDVQRQRADVIPLTRQMSTVKIATAVDGIPFELNKKLGADSIKDFSLPEMQYQTEQEIENKYKYDFTAERTAAARIPPNI
ncbi:PREDICTED: multivesicular body subunit 12B-like isoform X2 [Branchiostoma belcheri]|uniref:Multivesicular body subunit 12B-like isoform X2 n=1 Tax=Branchiostoma belcheri TaxID=7741 RepID=A0A6P4ZHW5_BRABE|nr:PREDICTED: multivesicular body subunit 12B-like isoform X2 [Branchiostoma belcheri]